MKATRLIINCIITILCSVYYTSEAIKDQHDFFTIFQRMEVTYINRTFLKGIPIMKVTKYNRTSWEVNFSAHLPKDIDGRILQDTTRGEVLLSNKYIFTGIQVKANVCEIYDQNQGGMKTFFEKYSNIDLCNLTKGHKYIHGHLDHFSFPDNIAIPFGNFRITFDVNFLTGGKLIQIQMFVTSRKYVKEMGKKPNFGITK